MKGSGEVMNCLRQGDTNNEVGHELRQSHVNLCLVLELCDLGLIFSWACL